MINIKKSLIYDYKIISKMKKQLNIIDEKYVDESIKDNIDSYYIVTKFDRTIGYIRIDVRSNEKVISEIYLEDNYINNETLDQIMNKLEVDSILIITKNEQLIKILSQKAIFIKKEKIGNLYKKTRQILLK